MKNEWKKKEKKEGPKLHGPRAYTRNSDQYCTVGVTYHIPYNMYHTKLYHTVDREFLWSGVLVDLHATVPIMASFLTRHERAQNMLVS